MYEYRFLMEDTLGDLETEVNMWAKQGFALQQFLDNPEVDYYAAVMARYYPPSLGNIGNEEMKG